MAIKSSCQYFYIRHFSCMLCACVSNGIYVRPHTSHRPYVGLTIHNNNKIITYYIQHSTHLAYFVFRIRIIVTDRSAELVAMVFGCALFALIYTSVYA